MRDRTQTGALERQIDKMVYKLYGLTPEEIAIVEGRGDVFVFIVQTGFKPVCTGFGINDIVQKQIPH